MYQHNELGASWIDAIVSVGQKAADMNAARRQQANAAAAQRAAANVPTVISGSGQPKSNTFMYVGIGAGILAVAGIVYKVISSRKK